MLFTCDKKATKTLISVALVCNRINDVQNIGSPTRTRTWDLRINSPSLYQLSYQGIEEQHYEWVCCFRQPIW